MKYFKISNLAVAILFLGTWLWAPTPTLAADELSLVPKPTPKITPSPEPEGKVLPRFYVANFPPYVIVGPTGTTGFFIDVIKAMASQSNYQGEIDVVPWKRAQNELLQLKDSNPKLILPLIRNAARELQYKWIAELYTDDIVLIMKAGIKKKIKTLEDAKGLKIGVVGGSALLADIKNGGFELETSPDIENCARKLKAGRIDAWYVTRWVGQSTLKKVGMANDQFKMSATFLRIPIFLGASPDTPDEYILSWTKAFQAIKDNGTYENILKNWHSETGIN